MLQPKRTKFRKQFKGRIHGNAKGGTNLDFGGFGLKALEPNRRDLRMIGGQEGEPEGSFALFRPLYAERRHLIERLSRANAENDPTRKHAAQRTEALRNGRRMLAECRSSDARAHHDAFRARAERAQPRWCIGGMSAIVSPGLKMVADEDGIESEFLGEHRIVQEATGLELLG